MSKLKFPARYTINLVRDRMTDEQWVAACLTSNQKVSQDNIKYKDVKHFSWDGNKRVALLEVDIFQYEDELAERLLYHGEHWNVGMKKPPE